MSTLSCSPGATARRCIRLLSKRTCSTRLKAAGGRTVAWWFTGPDHGARSICVVVQCRWGHTVGDGFSLVGTSHLHVHGSGGASVEALRRGIWSSVGERRHWIGGWRAGCIRSVHVGLAGCVAVGSIVVMSRRSHGLRVGRTLPHGHGMLRLRRRSHTLRSVVHWPRRLRCHGVRSSRRRHSAKNVVEGGVSLMFPCGAISGGPRAMVTRVRRTIVCHAQSRGSRYPTRQERDVRYC